MFGYDDSDEAKVRKAFQAVSEGDFNIEFGPDDDAGEGYMKIKAYAPGYPTAENSVLVYGGFKDLSYWIAETVREAWELKHNPKKTEDD